MAKFNVTLKIDAATPADAQKLADLLQNAATVVAYNDIVKLLEKVKANPSLVKTALKFI